MIKPGLSLDGCFLGFVGGSHPGFVDVALVSTVSAWLGGATESET